MSTSLTVTVSVTPVPARRRAYWSEDGERLVLEPLQPLDYGKKPLQPLDAFRRLWRSLEGGAVDDFARFREAIPNVITRAGCLAPHQALPEPPRVAGLIEVEPTPLLDTFSGRRRNEENLGPFIGGWLEAAVRAHLWTAALKAENERILPFVESWLKSVHQHLGLEGETWRKHYPLLFSLEDEPRWTGSPEQHQRMQRRLERLGVEHLCLPLDAPMNAAARLVALHQGRRLLSSRLIRQHLHTEGLRGLRIPTVYPSLVCDTPVVAETGLYHLALLRLGRSPGLRACGWCGSLFQPQRSTARFCSSACRKAAHLANT